MHREYHNSWIDMDMGILVQIFFWKFVIGFFEGLVSVEIFSVIYDFQFYRKKIPTLFFEMDHPIFYCIFRIYNEFPYNLISHIICLIGASFQESLFFHSHLPKSIILETNSWRRSFLNVFLKKAKKLVCRIQLMQIFHKYKT